LPNVEETERYITSRLLNAGAERTDIFSPGAIDYIFRCSDGIPRNVNNLCDNALLTGFAAQQATIGRQIIEEVADTFDMLPRSDRGRQTGEEREAPARIFTAAGRAELWAAGTGESGNGSDHSADSTAAADFHHPASSNLAAASPLAMREDVDGGSSQEPPLDAGDVGAAFNRSGLTGGSR